MQALLREFYSMKGIVTYYSKLEDKGSILSEDGKIYSFTSKDCEGDFTLSDIKEPVEATFEVSKENDANTYQVSHVAAKRIDPESKVFYDVPSRVGISFSKPDDYEVIVESEYPITKIGRNSNLTQKAVIDECTRIGGNAVLDYKERKILKNSIGFSFYVYEGSGYPSVIARRNDKGRYSKSDLKNLLDNVEAKKIYQGEVNSKIGFKILKIIGAILFVIFTIGFFLSK